MGIDVGHPIAAARLDDLDQIGVAEPVERPEGCGVELRRVADDAGIELHPALVKRDPLVVPGERPERAAHEVHRVVQPVLGAGVGVARPEGVDRLVAADALPRREAAMASDARTCVRLLVSPMPIPRRPLTTNPPSNWTLSTGPTGEGGSATRRALPALRASAGWEVSLSAAAIDRLASEMLTALRRFGRMALERLRAIGRC